MARRGRGRPLTASVWSMAGFGASYAVASLTCTIAPFLAVVVTAFRSGSLLDGVVLFLAYAVGMGALVGAAAVAVALAHEGLLRRMRHVGPVLPYVGGALLVLAGGYVAWYGAWELRVLHADAGADPVVDGAEVVQQWLADTASSIGAAGFLGLVAVLLVLGLAVRRGRAPHTSRVPRRRS